MHHHNMPCSALTMLFSPITTTGFEVDICEGAALGQPSVFVTEVLPSSVAHTAGMLSTVHGVLL